MNRKEAVRRIVAVSEDVPSVMEVTRQLAVRCESEPHEWADRTNACAWCGKPRGEDDPR